MSATEMMDEDPPPCGVDAPAHGAESVPLDLVGLAKRHPHAMALICAHLDDPSYVCVFLSPMAPLPSESRRSWQRLGQVHSRHTRSTILDSLHFRHPHAISNIVHNLFALFPPNLAGAPGPDLPRHQQMGARVRALRQAHGGAGAATSTPSRACSTRPCRI